MSAHPIASTDLYGQNVPRTAENLNDDHTKSAGDWWDEATHAIGVLTKRIVKFGGIALGILSIAYAGRWEREFELSFNPLPIKPEHFISDDGLNQVQAKRLTAFVNLCMVKNGATPFCKENPISRALSVEDQRNVRAEQLETAQAERNNFPPRQ